MNFRFRSPFPRDYDIERIPEIRGSSAIRRIGDGGGPILRVVPYDGDPFLLCCRIGPPLLKS
jgi:hypothetical protein